VKMNKAEIYYKDIGDYLSREEKLRIVSEGRSILNPDLKMTKIKPNEHGDWINKRNSKFDEFIPLEPEQKFDDKTQSYFSIYSLGIATNKDAWLYNYSFDNLERNVKEMIVFYNSQRITYQKLIKTKIISAKDAVVYDSSKINWTDMFLKDIENNIKYELKKDRICISLYRPFIKMQFCYEKQFIQRTYQQQKLFPVPQSKNLVLCMSGIGSTKSFSTLITDIIPCLDLVDKSQCYPLYWYEKKEEKQHILFENSGDEYIRHDAISDFILDQAKTRYGGRVAKEDIFYYVYGILHCPDYRKTFANDLKKMLPRLPLVEKPADFWAFSEAGRKLAELHLNYEDQPSPKDILINGKPIPSKPFSADQLIVNQMKFLAKGQKDTIIYNHYISISNIPPKAYEYIVNGKSAIEWVMERYAVTTHKESGIKNDPNDWAVEHENPQYILDLLLSVITVSVKTADIVARLPKVEWE